MFTVLRQRAADEKGFTLIELLVVILIIGILAAVALPAFLGQRQKGQDSAAKSNIRNVISQMESCFVQEESYDGCDTQLIAEPGGLPVVAYVDLEPGEVAVEVTDPERSYWVEAHSKASTGSTLHRFGAHRHQQNGTEHDCVPRGKGGCPTDGDW